jgi:hypothetical protein
MKRRSSVSWMVSVGLGSARRRCRLHAPAAKAPSPLPQSDQVDFNPITKVSPAKPSSRLA